MQFVRPRFLSQRANLVALIVLALAVCGTSPARASLLNLTPHPPDITANLVSLQNTHVAFNSNTLQANGAPVTIYYGGNAAANTYNILDDTFQAAQFAIQVQVDQFGNASSAPGDDLVITGGIDFDRDGLIDNGETFDTLLTGEISQFGFQDVAPYRLLEFVFHVTGGTQAALFGSQVGVVLDANAYSPGSGFTGTWDRSFANSGLGNADIFPVPAPGSLAALLLSLGPFAAVRFVIANRQRRRRDS